MLLNLKTNFNLTLTCLVCKRLVKSVLTDSEVNQLINSEVNQLTYSDGNQLINSEVIQPRQADY